MQKSIWFEESQALPLLKENYYTESKNRNSCQLDFIYRFSVPETNRQNRLVMVVGHSTALAASISSISFLRDLLNSFEHSCGT